MKEDKDEADDYSARPDFGVLCYPAIAEEVQGEREERYGFPVADYGFIAEFNSCRDYVRGCLVGWDDFASFAVTSAAPNRGWRSRVYFIECYYEKCQFLLCMEDGSHLCKKALTERNDDPWD